MWLLLSIACDVDLMIGGVVADEYCEAADPDDDIEYRVEVTPGTTSRSLGAILEEHQIVESGEDFTTCVRFSDKGSCEIKAGAFKLSRAMDVDTIFEVVCGDPIPDVGVPLTIAPGWRIREIDAALTAQGLIGAGEYIGMVNRPAGFTAPFDLPDDTLEGYLFPETYMIDESKWDTRSFIQRQLDLFTERFYTPQAEAIAASKVLGRNLHQIVIMASMLEKEEPKAENRPLVSGIIWKRLDSGWKLGIDATSRYTLAEWNDRTAFLKKLRDPSDPYNTRLRQGLPPTAIGNPTLSALDAALNPEESDYWFYLHDSEKNLHPAKDQRGHEANRRKYNVY